MVEKEKDLEIPRLKFNKKVSLFRKRRKLGERPFVKETKYKKFKKTLLKIFLLLGILFSIIGLLWFVRFVVLPYVFESKNSSIIKPSGKVINAKQIEAEIRKSGLDIEDINITTDLTMASFTIRRETKVNIDPRKEIGKDLAVLRVIINELTENNKRASFIDLRFSKPIVKF